MSFTSFHVPNFLSISRYVNGANPRSPDDGKGGKICTPPLNMSEKSFSRSSFNVYKSPPNESGWLITCTAFFIVIIFPPLKSRCSLCLLIFANRQLLQYILIYIHLLQILTVKLLLLFPLF